jgi:hypothetical protein
MRPRHDAAAFAPPLSTLPGGSRPKICDALNSRLSHGMPALARLHWLQKSRLHAQGLATECKPSMVELAIRSSGDEQFRSYALCSW